MTKTAHISGTPVSSIAVVFAAFVVGVLSASYAPMGVAKDTPNADVVTSSTSGSAPSMPLPPATQPPPILAFDEAVAHVTTAVFSTAPSADAAVIPVAARKHQVLRVWGRPVRQLQTRWCRRAALPPCYQADDRPPPVGAVMSRPEPFAVSWRGRGWRGDSPPLSSA